MSTRTGVLMGFTAKENFAARVGFFYKLLKKKKLLNRVYIKGNHVDYINERFSFSI